ncbi:MAG: flagellar basal body P-ring protein FlgI [Ignavibacteriaceae bacterium]|jgi:flagellar P-ring protein precursor FlgI
MKKIFLISLLLLSISFEIYSQRIKDIAYLGGENSEQILGYGLIVGLSGTGDSHRSVFTIQSITSMLKRFGITVPQADLKTKNVAAVMVTATLNAYLKSGAKFDVNVSSLGDATSLLGGTLLMTPLSGSDGNVYGYAQGSISVGGFDISTPTGGRVAKNSTLAGRIPRGGLLQMEVSSHVLQAEEISVYLKDPDMTTANNISNAINAKFGASTALASDAAEIKVKVSADKQANMVGFLAELEGLTVEIDYAAKVVLNERTGTVVSGSNVKIQSVTISHGGLNLSIKSYPVISQPGAFSNGTTAVFNNLVPYASQDSSSTIAIQGASNVQEVAAALNSLKVSPKDIIAIFQALKEAGALIAELVII